eukprot:11221-Pyramimonas_sp.AAC.1
MFSLPSRDWSTAVGVVGASVEQVHPLRLLEEPLFRRLELLLLRLLQPLLYSHDGANQTQEARVYSHDGANRTQEARVYSHDGANQTQEARVPGSSATPSAFASPSPSSPARGPCAPPPSRLRQIYHRYGNRLFNDPCGRLFV